MSASISKWSFLPSPKKPSVRSRVFWVSLLASGLVFATGQSLCGQGPMIQGEGAEVEATEGQDGKVTLFIRLSDADSGMEGSLRLVFGTGLSTDLSKVTLKEPPTEGNKLQLRAERSDAGISEIMEVEILDDHVVKISFPDLAPQRPDIAFVYDLVKLKYTKARSGSKLILAVDDVTHQYQQALAEDGYWIFYGSETFPPLIITGFSDNRLTLIQSAGGILNSTFNSDETATVSFLSIPDREAWNDEATLMEAGKKFFLKNAN